MAQHRYAQNKMFVLNEPTGPRLSVALATEIGLNESLILLQLEFHIAAMGVERDGERWAYRSIRDLQETFPFLSIATINRTIQSLMRMGLIKTADFNRAKYDRTRWFALDPAGFAGLKSVHLIANSTDIGGYETRSAQNETRSAQNETTIHDKSNDKSNDDVCDAAIADAPLAHDIVSDNNPEEPVLMGSPVQPSLDLDLGGSKEQINGALQPGVRALAGKGKAKAPMAPKPKVEYTGTHAEIDYGALLSRARAAGSDTWRTKSQQNIDAIDELVDAGASLDDIVALLAYCLSDPWYKNGCVPVTPGTCKNRYQPWVRAGRPSKFTAQKGGNSNASTRYNNRPVDYNDSIWD
jgi:hypothetical protein